MRKLTPEELIRNKNQYLHILAVELKKDGKQQILNATTKDVLRNYYNTPGMQKNKDLFLTKDEMYKQYGQNTIFQCLPQEWHTLLPYLKIGKYVLVQSRI